MIGKLFFCSPIAPPNPPREGGLNKKLFSSLPPAESRCGAFTSDDTPHHPTLSAGHSTPVIVARWCQDV